MPASTASTFPLKSSGAESRRLTLDGASAELAAAVSRSGDRYAVLTISRQPSAPPDAYVNPLLDQPVDDSPAVIWLKDLEGRYLRVNRRYTEETQTPADAVRGKTEAELSPMESIEAARLASQGAGTHEPLELEYTVAAFDSRPAYAVLRFALRARQGEPVAVCGVAAPLAEAYVARTECVRLMRIERWSRLDPEAIRQELLDDAERDRSREGLLIGERDHQIKMSVVAPMKTLLDAHVFAVSRAARIEPSTIVEPGRVNHERVAIPSSNGIPLP